MIEIQPLNSESLNFGIRNFLGVTKFRHFIHPPTQIRILKKLAHLIFRTALAIPKGLFREFRTTRHLIPRCALGYLVWLEAMTVCHRATGKFPNLLFPEHLNDYIALEKLKLEFARVFLSDKTSVRHFVVSKSPNCVTLDISVLEKVSQIREFDPDQWVFKANHDSGSVRFSNSKKDERFLRNRIRTYYGIPDGEWPYRFIKPVILAEKRLPINPIDIVDYKFHCSKGRVFAVQVISKRFSNEETEEVMVDEAGELLGVLLDQGFYRSNDFKRPKQWLSLVNDARLLSEGFDYVRVDLYAATLSTDTYFGEMTFYPHGGTYQTDGGILLGKFLTKLL